MFHSEYNYSIVEEIAVISQRGSTTKELNIVSHNHESPKYDIRAWNRDGDERKMLRGISLTADEARALKQALNERTEL